MCAAQNQIRSRQRHVSAAPYSLPSICFNRCAGIHGVKTEFAIDELRLPIPGKVAHRPHQWQGIVCPSGSSPLLPGIFQKIYVPLAVRRHVARSFIRSPRDDVTQRGGVYARQYGLSALRIFKRGG